MTQDGRNAVIAECAEVARAFGKKFDDSADDLFQKPGEWRDRAKARAAEEIEKAILALTWNDKQGLQAVTSEDDIVDRAKMMATSIAMGEKLPFGADNKMLLDLADEVTKLREGRGTGLERRYTESEWLLIAELRKNWPLFCDADPFEGCDTFTERMEAAGYITLRTATEWDVQATAFPEELGISAGEPIWVLTDKGSEILRNTEKCK